MKYTASKTPTGLWQVYHPQQANVRWLFTRKRDAEKKAALFNKLGGWA